MTISATFHPCSSPNLRIPQVPVVLPVGLNPHGLPAPDIWECLLLSLFSSCLDFMDLVDRVSRQTI